VIIMEKQDNKTLFVDTWFMSCRVLKRGMENFTLNTMVECAKALSFERIVGEYIPTLKNGMVKEHYPNLGFKALGENLYELDVNTYTPRECFIKRK